ncbi:MAG: hypothetical protein AB7P40_13290 [Chloroflexota bacterium]
MRGCRGHRRPGRREDGSYRRGAYLGETGTVGLGQRPRAQRHDWDRHVDEAIDKPFDYDLDGHFYWHITRDDPNLNARHAILSQYLQDAEQWQEQRQQQEETHMSHVRQTRP